MLSEQEMLAALRRRDPAAFSQLFETYSDRIYRLAVGLLENEIEAEGVVQDTFMRLFERLDQFEGRSKLGTWIYRVAYNLCQDRLRIQRPAYTLTMDVDDDETLPVPEIFVDWSQVPERYLTEAEITAEYLFIIQRRGRIVDPLAFSQPVRSFILPALARTKENSPICARPIAVIAETLCVCG